MPNSPRDKASELLIILQTGSCGNDSFGSRREPGTAPIASILLSRPGEAPEGRPRGVQDNAIRVQTESEC
jgi:hypothetical protein